MNYKCIHNSLIRPSLRIYATLQCGVKSSGGLITTMYDCGQSDTNEETLCAYALATDSHFLTDKTIIN